jgi:hypothetical protein
MTRKTSYSHSASDPGYALEESEFQSNNWKPAIQHTEYTKFHLPRSSLAYCEIRLILCKLLFNFDITLSPESTNWPDQKVYFLWEKPPLMVKLTDRFPNAEMPPQEPLTMSSK